MEIVEAWEIPTGDGGEGGAFIPGLDNAYVIDVETDPDIRNEDNVQIAGEGYVCVTFNDNHGDEGYLILPRETPVTIRRQRNG